MHQRPSDHKLTHQKMCGKPSSQMSSLQSWFPTAMLPRNWIPHRIAAKGEREYIDFSTRYPPSHWEDLLDGAETLETHHHKYHSNLLTKSWGVWPKSQKTAWWSLDLCEDKKGFLLAIKPTGILIMIMMLYTDSISLRSHWKFEKT